MSHRIVMLIGAMVSSLGAMAQPESFICGLRQISSPVNIAFHDVYALNPATMYYRDSLSVSSLSVGWDYQHESRAVMEQTGRGHSLFDVSAGSYMRLEKRQVVWGEASFVTGLYRDIKWTDCIDYQKVAPYVLGDEAGGDMSARRYAFSGGYSTLLGRWTLGIEASYRAELAYRDSDPRVKDVVSDLSIGLGAALRLNSHHAIGFGGTLNIYNQDCDLDFYNPLNEINTYTLTGAGTYYRRFMGNSNKNSGYRSIGYGAGLQYVPAGESRQGVFATFDYGHYRMEQQLRNFNNLTLGFSDNDILSAVIGYRKNLGPAIVIQPQVSGRMLIRKGTENLFGTSTGASYDRIGSRKPYDFESCHFVVRCPLQLDFGSDRLTFVPGIGGESVNEKYTDPQRKLSASHLIPEFTVDYSRIASRIWLFEGGIGVSYAKAFYDDPVLTGLDMESTLGQSVVNNFSMLKADRVAVGAKIGVSRQMCGFVMSFALLYGACDYDSEGLMQNVGVSLSAKF